MAKRLRLEKPQRYLWAMVGLILVAALFRFCCLDSVPRGLSHDEANNGLMAGEVLKGFHPVFFEIYTGVEPGLIYPQAVAFWLFGRGATVERWVSATFGLLTVVLTYAFATRLLQSRRIGLASATLVAISFWTVFVSRLGLRAVVMPPLQMLCLLFFWRALVRRRLLDFALAGLFGGLTMYTYLASRFLPLVPIIFLAYLLVRRFRLRAAWPGLALMVGIWMLVFLPLGFYYLNNPHWFLLRAGQSLVEPGGAGAVLSGLASETLATLGMFSFQGDGSWRYNLAGRPVFDWVWAIAFYAGIALSFYRAIKLPKLNPFAYLLAIQFVMLVPDFVTQGSPHFLRSIGTVPTTFIFPAIALDALYRLVRPRWRGLLLAAAGVWLAVTAYSTYHDYFRVWALNAKAREVYSAPYAEIASYLGDFQESPAIIASASPNLDRLALDLAAGPGLPEVRWFDATQTLVVPGGGKGAIYFLPTTIEMPSPLRRQLAGGNRSWIAAPDGRPSVEVVEATLDIEPAQPLHAMLGDQVRILGYNIAGGTSRVGEDLDLWLHWHVETNPDPRRQWTWFVHMVDRRGYEWVRWSGQGLEVADWRPGDQVIQHVPLSIPFDAPDIDYHLEIGVFDRLSGDRLAATEGGDHVEVAGIRVLPGEPSAVAGLIAEREKGQLAEGLAFLGSTVSSSQVEPGAVVTVTLAWAPTEPMEADHTFRLKLATEDGEVVHEQTWSPFGGEYPASAWPVGLIVRDVVELSVPGDAPTGRMSLEVSVVGQKGSVRGRRIRVVRPEIEP